MFDRYSKGNTVVWENSSVMYNTSGAPVTEGSPTNNLTRGDSGSLLSQADFLLASVVVECGFTPVLGLLGFLANLLNMAVFYRQGLRDKMNLCLFALAFADFMFLFTMCLSTVSCFANLFPDSVLLQLFKWNTLKYTNNFQNAFWYSSGVLTAIIAAERCICVVWPLKSSTIFTTKSMACLIVGAFVALNLLCVQYILKHDVILEAGKSGKITVFIQNTNFYLNNKQTYHIIRDTVLPSISFITFFVVSFVTVVTVRKLKTAMDWRQKTSSTVMDKRQLSLVKILITVSCIYIACSLPKLLLAVARFLVEDFSRQGAYKDVYFLTHRVALLLHMVNSSVNIFIYCRQSSRFRKELRAWACCCRDEIEQNCSMPRVNTLNTNTT